MASNGADKRRYPRIYFPAELAVSGTIAVAERPDKELPVSILNLSEGGLFFTLGKEQGKQFAGKQTLLFKGMAGPAPFNLGQDAVVAIRWVLDSEIMDNIGYGCEFVDLPSHCVMQLRGMVDQFLAAAGRQ